MTRLEGIRLSELARCPRATVARGLGVLEAPVDERGRRLRARGHLFGAYVAAQFRELYGDVVRELAVDWPLGTGHVDIYVPAERLAVEVKTTTSPASLIDSAIWQLRAYMRFGDAIERGLLYLVDPVDLDREDAIPVWLNDEHVDEIDARVAAVTAALNDDPLDGPGETTPPCSCATPTACRRSFCAFTDWAWRDWVAPTLEEIAADAAVTSALAAHRNVQQVERDARVAHELATSARREVEVDLANHIPAGDWKIGDYRVRRTVSKGRETFRLSEARKAGAWTDATDDLWRDFVRVGEPVERWTVKQADTPDGDLEGWS